MLELVEVRLVEVLTFILFAATVVVKGFPATAVLRAVQKVTAQVRVAAHQQFKSKRQNIAHRNSLKKEAFCVA